MTSDEFKYYAQVIRRVFGPTAVYVQVDNCYRRNRIVRTKARRCSPRSGGTRPRRAGWRTPHAPTRVSRPLTFREIFTWVPPPRPGARRAKLQWGW